MKKKKLLNRLLSALLAVIMTIGLIPMGSVTVKAETKNATLSNLGALGTVKIGSKFKKIIHNFMDFHCFNVWVHVS